ncbi:hypothetical protein [Streptomyces sp. cg36]|uniref:hypothetical protein n=1 Tax=Streptomyces sp. cg36 TaxID=3238798 RepID=UPI0034E2B179
MTSPIRSRLRKRPLTPAEIGAMSLVELRIFAYCTAASAAHRKITIRELASLPGPHQAPLGAGTVLEVLGDFADDGRLSLTPDNAGLDTPLIVFVPGYQSLAPRVPAAAPPAPAPVARAPKPAKQPEPAPKEPDTIVLPKIPPASGLVRPEGITDKAWARKRYNANVKARKQAEREGDSR